MHQGLVLRTAQPIDVSALRELIARSAKELSGSHYSAEQIEAAVRIADQTFALSCIGLYGGRALRADAAGERLSTSRPHAAQFVTAGYLGI